MVYLYADVFKGMVFRTPTFLYTSMHMCIKGRAAGKAPLVYLNGVVYKGRIVGILSFVYFHADVY